MAHHSRPRPYSAQKPKPKDKRPSPPELLRFVWHLSVSSDLRDVIQAPEPCDIIKALDPSAQLLLCSTPQPWVRMGPYLFLLRIGALPIMQDYLRTCSTWFIIRSRLPWSFLAPTAVTGRSYATPHPTMSTSTGWGATVVQAPHLFHRCIFRATKSSSSWHRVRVWLRHVIYSHGRPPPPPPLCECTNWEES
jgi:hypothetical protein